MKRKHAARVCALMMSAAMMVSSVPAGVIAEEDIVVEEVPEAYSDEAVCVQDADAGEIMDITPVISAVPEEDILPGDEQDVTDGEPMVAEDSDLVQLGETVEAAGSTGEEIVVESVEEAAAPLYDADAEKKSFSMTGKINTGTDRTMVLSGTTSIYNSQTWQNATITFESSDATTSGANTIYLKPVIGSEDDSIAIGTGYSSSSKNVTGALSSNGGYYTSSFKANTNGPAKETKPFYIVVTHTDNSKEYYKLSAIRKGYAGEVWNQYSNYQEGKTPYNLSSFDEKTQRMYAGSSFVNNAVTIYNADGDKVGIGNFTVPESSTEFLSLEGTNYYATVPGIYPVTYACEVTNKTYTQYVVARYAKNIATDLVNAAKTDGRTNLEKIEDKSSFVEMFDSDYADTAGEFYDTYSYLKGQLNGTWESLAQYEDSLKVYQFTQQAPDIWENVYGMKAAKEQIGTILDPTEYSEEKQTVIDNVVDKYCDLIDLGYSKGTINSAADVQAMVAEAKEELIRRTVVSLKDCKVSLSETEYTYDGTEKKPAVTVTDSSDNKIEAENYKVTYSDNVNAGQASVTVSAVSGSEKYTGSNMVAFEIKKADQVITVEKTAFDIKTGDPADAIDAKVSGSGKLFFDTSDEKVAYVSSGGKIIARGEGKTEITVSGEETANYLAPAPVKISVTVTKMMEETEPVTEKDPTPETEPSTESKPSPETKVPAADLKDCTITLAQTAYTYNGEARIPGVVVKDSAGKEVASENYEVSYFSNKNAGTAVVLVKGKGIEYTGSQMLNFEIQKAPQKITVIKTSYALAKSTKGTALKVTTDSKLAPGYKSSNTKVAVVSSTGVIYPVGKGTAVITVSCEESANYSAAKSVKVKVSVVDQPKKLSAPSLVSKKAEQLTVTWKKDKKANGYEVMAATNSKFTKNVTTAIVKKNTKVSTVLKKLKSGKKYYVRVRSMKSTANGTVYGAWSAVKTLKVK